MKEKQTNPAVCGRSTVGHPKTAKRILALLLTVATLATTLCLPAFAVEEGEAETPSVTLEQDENGYYLIASAADFLQIKNDLTAKYKLTADIEFDEPLPLGTKVFSGTLDGDNHIITIVNAYKATSSRGMFFNSLNNATVENLQLGTQEKPMKVTSLSSSSANVGILGDFAGGVVEVTNVHIYADVVLETWGRSTANFGIFFARANESESLTIKDCSANGWIQTPKVGGTKKIGGFVATFTKALTFENCVNNVNITGKTTNIMYIGGFGGNIKGMMTLKNCVNNGVISCENLGTGTVDCGAFYTLGDGGSVDTMTGCVNIGTVNGETVSEDGIANNLDGITGAIAQTNKGAGVRIVLDDKGTGLRFKFTMDETSIANLDLLSRIYGKDNVQVGAIILPTDLLKNGELTEENYSNALTMAGSASEVTDGYYHASLVNLYVNHYTTAYSCQSFYRYRTSADGEWITVYANNTESRTIAVVAADALDDPNKPNYSTEQLAILNAYAGRTN